tara:strand:- start:172 stop:2538 length:2367 start_codon:yes stop_codon:yes gene_type:complete
MPLDITSITYSTTGMGGIKDNRPYQEAIKAPIDLIFMQWDDADLNAQKRFQRSSVLRRSEVEKIQSGSGQRKLVIAHKSFGDFDPTRGEVQDLEIQMQWDKNRDGIPDDDAPKWFAPVNLSWQQPDLPEERYGYKNHAYLDKHPLYLVRYWEDEWINYIKQFIDKLAQNGWDGIFLDVVGSHVWTKKDNLRDETYTNNELADFTYKSLSEIKNHISLKRPTFKLIINATESENWLHLKPEISTLVDGMILENFIFYSGNRDSNREANLFPATSKFIDYRGDSLFRNLQSTISKSNGKPVLMPVDAIEYDYRSLTQLARLSDQFRLVPNIKYDQLERVTNDTTVDWKLRKSILPLLYSYVDINRVNNLENKNLFPSLLVGLDGDDVLIGNIDKDIIIGGSGNDMISGNNGIDISVYQQDSNKYSIIKNENESYQISIKPEYRNLHKLKISLVQYPLPNQNAIFSLTINNKLVISNQEILTNEEKEYTYELNEPINTFVFHHTTQKYDDNLKASLGIVIKSISINQNLVDLSEVIFLDGEEDWAGYSNIFNNINPGRGRVSFSTEKYNGTITNEGTDTLDSIERLSFTDQDLYLIGEKYKPINYLGEVPNKSYSGNSTDYKFYNLGNDNYGIGTTKGIDELTGASILKFDDKDMNLVNDIKKTFDQVTGLNTDSGRMFRLYNASFKRLPDPDGLKYWITQFSSGANDIRTVASSFLGSAEFAQRYGDEVTDKKYVTTLYQNVLGRAPDTSGLNYWLGQLSSGAETRYEALLGFAESAENKALFTEMTGFG